MTKVKDIYSLIKSLSEVEVEQFRMYAASARDGITANVVSLFEALYDESRSSSGHYDRIQVLPDVKQLLYKHLLRFLRYFHDEQDIALQIGNKIREAKVLYDKCLTDLADEVLADAKNIAYHFERFYYLLQIINIEKTKLHRINSLGEAQAHRLKLEDEESEAMYKLQNYIEYRNMSKQISEIYRLPEKMDKSTKIERLSQLFSSQLLNDESSAVSLTAKYYFLHERSTYFYYLGDVHKAWENNNSLLELIKTKPFLIDLSIEGFVVTFYNNLVFNLELEHYVEFEKKIKEFKRIPDSMRKYDSFQFRKMIFERTEFLELKKLLCLGKFEEGIALIPETFSEMESYGELLDSYYRAQFYFIFAYFCFIEEQFEEALSWTLKILDMKECREDIQVNALMLKHIVEFELQDEKTFRDGLPATLSFLKESKRMMTTEKVLLDTLDSIFGIKKKLTVKNSFKKLKDELQEVGNDPFERNNLSNFDYLAWVDAKIGSQPFRAIFSKRELSHKFRVIR